MVAYKIATVITQRVLKETDLLGFFACSYIGAYLDTPDPTETSKMTMVVNTTRARAFIVSQGMNDSGLPENIRKTLREP